MARKKRNGELTPSSDVLQSLLESPENPLADQFLRWRLWARWVEILGNSIGDNTAPVGYNRGCLIVWVKSSSWMQQITFMSGDIISAINKSLGRPFVRRIRYTLDRHEVPIEDGDRQDPAASFKNQMR